MERYSWQKRKSTQITERGTIIKGKFPIKNGRIRRETFQVQSTGLGETMLRRETSTAVNGPDVAVIKVSKFTT